MARPMNEIYETDGGRSGAGLLFCRVARGKSRVAKRFAAAPAPSGERKSLNHFLRRSRARESDLRINLNQTQLKSRQAGGECNLRDLGMTRSYLSLSAEPQRRPDYYCARESSRGAGRVRNKSF